MTEAEFEALVGRLEPLAQANPRAYGTRVLLLALLGNAYLAFVLLLLLALLGASIASIAVLKAGGVKLTLIVGAFVWLVLKALWVRIDAPAGTRVSAAQAPELFAMIEQLRAALGAPRFHRVLITDEFNAGVQQSPRLGVFGWQRNYLLLGLPLMKSLSAEQFKAVLAHEFGHLAKGHGRLSNWIYRQRLRWLRLSAALGAHAGWGAFLFKPFLAWFAPYFHAYSFPLARANEYEADATSARLTSRRAAAEALTSVNVIGAYLGERYWPQIHKLADDMPQPGFAPYSRLTERIAAELEPALAQRWLAQALARKTSHADTHPALGDRLEAIAAEPVLAPPAAEQGADRLLGAAREALSEAFDSRWRESIRGAWQQRHQHVQEGRRALAALDAKVRDGGGLSPDDACERAELTGAFGNDADAAIEQLRALLVLAPDHARAAFALGRQLLARDDDAGVEFLQRAMQLDREAIPAGAQLLRDHHWRHGREADARLWHQRLEEHQRTIGLAQRERNRVLLTDRFVAPQLDAATLETVRAQLRAVPRLRRAYLLRKEITHLPQFPFYVLAFSATRWFEPHRRGRDGAVTARIRSDVELPGDAIIVSIDGRNSRFGRLFRKLRWARIV